MDAEGSLLMDAETFAGGFNAPQPTYCFVFKAPTSGLLSYRVPVTCRIVGLFVSGTGGCVLAKTNLPYSAIPNNSVRNDPSIVAVIVTSNVYFPVDYRVAADEILYYNDGATTAVLTVFWTPSA
jgi:hypothetical protein